MNSLNSFSCENKVICFCQVSTVSHTNCVRVRTRDESQVIFYYFCSFISASFLLGVCFALKTLIQHI